ncbi:MULTISPECIES: glycosyltransferase family 2 protein [unclassified Paenibacillus]|uniref:glycosyltransferase family 2 protein n=1 Tax=unclassified Paenibacillus TaxID=185978 RepID=UPI0030F5C35A
MPTISLCMIVRNEEKSLGRCLASVADIVDEIVIVDTGSTDRTKEIAASFGARIYDFEWTYNFAAARNYSFSLGTSEYLLWLDADDVIEEADRVRFKALKTSLSSEYHSVAMSYILLTDSDGKPLGILRRNRLLRRDCHFQWTGAVHEYIEVTPPTLESDVCITHKKDKEYTERNLDIYRKMKSAGEEFSPRDQLYFANELFDHGYYHEALENYKIFLADGKGTPQEHIQAYTRMADSYGALGEKADQLLSLSHTFDYDIPQAENCCKMGYYFMDLEQYEQAIYWFELAVSLPRRDDLGLADVSSRTWLPHLQLCVCYDKVGQHRHADYCNEISLAQYAINPSAQYNRDYYTKFLGDKHVQIDGPKLKEREELAP